VVVVVDVVVVVVDVVPGQAPEQATPEPCHWPEYTETHTVDATSTHDRPSRP